MRAPGALVRPSLFQTAGSAVRTGAVAPPFTLPALGTSQAVSLRTADVGHVTVLNFWATWCHYCTKELPLLNSVATEHQDQVRVVGVDYTSEESSVAAVAAFVKKLHVQYPVLLDETGAAFTQYGVHAEPTTFFLNRKGVVTGQVIGQLTPDLLQFELLAAGAHVPVQGAGGSARSS